MLYYICHYKPTQTMCDINTNHRRARRSRAGDTPARETHTRRHVRRRSILFHRRRQVRARRDVARSETRRERIARVVSRSYRIARGRYGDGRARARTRRARADARLRTGISIRGNFARRARRSSGAEARARARGGRTFERRSGAAGRGGTRAATRAGLRTRRRPRRRRGRASDARERRRAARRRGETRGAREGWDGRDANATNGRLTTNARFRECSLRAAKAQKRQSLKTRASAATQPMWMPGATAPAHLKNELPGDYGFDPLELGKDPEDLKWYVQAELQHGRWAMLGVAGAAAPEILTNMGISNLPNWHEAPLYDGYFTDATTLFWVQMLMMNWAEVRRWQDIRKPGSVSEDPTPFSNAKLPAGVVGYPGGIFDPLGYAKGDLKTLKAKEIANGRLAMVAFAGIMVQYDHTGVGPVANLVSHMADPAHNNVFAAKFIGF